MVLFTRKTINGCGIWPVFLLFIQPSTVFGSDTGVLPPREIMSNARRSAMGGAGISIPDDGNGYSIFYNPAEIGSDNIDKSVFAPAASFPNFTLGLDKGSLDFYRAFIQGNKESKSRAIEQSIALAGEKKTIAGELSVFPTISFGRLQLGFFYHSFADGFLSKLNNPAVSKFATTSGPLSYNAVVNLQAMSTAALVGGFSVPVGAETSVGVSGRLSRRVSLFRQIEVLDSVVRKSNTSDSNFLNKTKGIALDFGILNTHPKVWLSPALALSIQDFGDTLYEGTLTNQHNEIEKMNVTVGTQIQPYASQSLYVLAAVDGSHLTDNRVPFGEKWGMGIETGVGMTPLHSPFVLRAGHNLRTLSFGFGIDLLFMKIDCTYYNKELKSEYGTLLDPRFLLHFSVDLRG